MTHIQITQEFTRLGLKAGSIVTIFFNNDTSVNGELSSIVHVEIDEQEKYIDSTSRFGLYPLPNNDGRTYSIEINTVYSKDLKSIVRFND